MDYQLQPLLQCICSPHCCGWFVLDFVDYNFNSVGRKRREAKACAWPTILNWNLERISKTVFLGPNATPTEFESPDMLILRRFISVFLQIPPLVTLRQALPWTVIGPLTLWIESQLPGSLRFALFLLPSHPKNLYFLFVHHDVSFLCTSEWIGSILYFIFFT